MTAIAVLTAIGCGGGDDGSGPPGSISLTASPTALSVEQGGTGDVTVTLVRGGGFSDPVTVTVEGLPNGATASVQPTQLTGNLTQATVTVTVATTVPAGTYPVTVRASATGVGSATASYTLTVTALPNYTLSMTPATVTIPPGGTGQSTVNITRTNFTGAVTLSLDTPPNGITATFNPAAPTGTTSTITVNVAANVANGNYTVTIKGAATGVPTAAAGLIDEAAAAGDRTTTLTVTVAPAPDFTISATPNAGNTTPGGSVNTTVTIARTNLTADIALSLVNPPGGITGAFTPATLTGATLSSNLVLNVAGSVTPGAYPVTVQGTGGGVTKTTVVTVTVATSSGNIVWDFCQGDDLPLKFWRLSGTTWAEVTPTTVGNVTRYSFTIASAQGGVAFTISVTSSLVQTSSYNLGALGRFRALPKAARDKLNAARMRASADVSLTSPYFDTTVLLEQASELSAEAGTCPTTANVAKTFTVAGQASNEEGLLGYGPGLAFLTYPQTSFNLQVPAGTYDWMAVFGPAPTFPDITHNWAAYRIGRGEAAPGATVAINRVGATAFTPFPVTVTGGNAGSLYSFSEYIEGARGEIISLTLGSQVGTSSTSNALFMAPADRLGTDLVSLVLGNVLGSGNTTDYRTTIRYLGSAPPASGTFALPAAVPPFTVSQVQGAPVTTWQASGQTPADYQTASSFIVVGFEGSSAVYTISASRGWLVANGFSTNYTLAGPNLPGFLAQWAPGAPLASTSVLMVGANFTTAPVAGSVAQLSIRQQ